MKNMCVLCCELEGRKARLCLMELKQPREREMKLRASTTALMLFCVVSFLGVFSAALQLPYNDEVLGLIVFKEDARDITFALSSWSEDDLSPCNWTGIQCNPVSGRVVGVTLDGLALSGHIGKGLSKLDQLRTLSLSRNNLSGAIDSSLAALTQLKYLNLGYNNLSGAIPAELGNITSLHALDLSNNALSGSIPQELFWSCKSLQFLTLASNLLEGTIPASLGNCNHLLTLDVSQNKLNGDIPATIGQLSFVRQIDLSNNSFSGRIPPNLAFLRSLASLKMHNAALIGSIPPELGNCSSLRVLDLSSNLLSGEMPISLQTLSWLLILRLHNNLLSGSIPPWIGRFSKLQELNLACNSFVGQIPASLGSLGSLHTLSLSQNRLEGVILPTISMCSKLSSLDLRGNNLTGPVIAQLFSLPFLQSVNLSMNYFSKELPALSPTDCATLQVLDLSSNRLVGAIPVHLSQCPQLQFLNLANNMLSGEISAEFQINPLLHDLDLSSNQLEGTIPDIFLNCSSLSELNLANNALQGSIPDTLFGCAALTDLNVSLNFLDGMLPMELGNLSGLKRLNISYNNFTGPIPENLDRLHNIASFDVSHNQLQGQIPTDGFFVNCNSCYFEGNAGLCGAAVDNACPIIPKPIVLNPNDTGVPNPIISSVGHSGKNVLTVSTIAAILAAAVIAVGIVIVTFLNLRARTARPQEKPGLFAIDSLPASEKSEELSIGKLVMFTDGMEPRSDELLPSANVLLNRSSEVGRGGFGIVYKAILADGRQVAVKKLTAVGLVQSKAEFQKEVHILGKIQHPHLVSLQGYCWTPMLQFLLYDFISNGSLYKRLHERAATEAPLTWAARFKIALGIASALAHLHHECHPRIIHFAVKSSNVLLDEDCSPHVSDYGLANLFPMVDRYALSSRYQTAQGYLAPECAYKNLKINEKCDIYGLGVILLELVTGRRPIEFMEDDVIILCDFVRSFMDEGKPLECVDQSLGSYSEDEVVPVIRLGLICTSHMPSNRPSMTEVVQILELIKPLGDGKESF
ncbi:hypothetical protein O6H91_11G109700 [Diphasiastrum complanatum]|uniref:Uncharacterized protein n=2 Tax=Diphasiastrum complanatum TaxID=34168 RepID=A0ACC2CCR9_DIPCM|nr:hypothetical protein O6H91_11G109700 [Diphasiastrum complanatum]KAJ7539809.1 hypothetical protein O6H91_11G109700 [Diphasiastrum complanatum]